MLNKFSEELKEARIKNDLTLQQMAARTRIDLKFLENLENGSFAFLPELYIKAFIKEYAKLVGLDEKITIKKFDAAKRSKAYDELGNTEDDIKKTRTEKEEIKPPKPLPEVPAYTPPVPAYEPYDSTKQQTDSATGLAKNKNLIIGIVVAVLAVFVIIYFAFIKGSSDIVVSEKTYDQVQKDNEQRSATEPQKPAASDSTYMAKSDSLSLVLESKDISWIKVIADGTKPVEFTLAANTQKEVKALKNFRITVGNAGAIQLTLNNKPLNFSGNKHEVKYVSVDSAGLHNITSISNP
jgi:cytoskeletal protein RodZ